MNKQVWCISPAILVVPFFIMISLSLICTHVEELHDNIWYLGLVGFTSISGMEYISFAFSNRPIRFITDNGECTRFLFLTIEMFLFSAIIFIEGCL